MHSPLTRKYFSIVPHRPGSPEAQLEECLFEYSKFLLNHRIKKEFTLKQTVFIQAIDNATFEDYTKRLDAVFENYYFSVPPTSYVTLFPENGNYIGLEIITLDNKGYHSTLERKKAGKIVYNVLTCNGYKEIFASGISSNQVIPKKQQYKEAFDQLSNILALEGMDFGDIERQWNYVENIEGSTVSGPDSEANISILNSLKNNYYQKSGATPGFPAFTEIGIQTGGILVDFIASKGNEIKAIPVNFPVLIAQRSTSSGNKNINKTIEKKDLKNAAIFIYSGMIKKICTSAITALKPENSKLSSNVEEQTYDTLENLTNLIKPQNIINSGYSKVTVFPEFLSYRVYVTNEEDIASVKPICKDYFGEIPGLFLLTESLRKDLLVEIECEADYF